MGLSLRTLQYPILERLSLLDASAIVIPIFSLTNFNRSGINLADIIIPPRLNIDSNHWII